LRSIKRWWNAGESNAVREDTVIIQKELVGGSEKKQERKGRKKVG